MTPIEYVQLKAFARIDGLMLALLWVASFACYIIGLSSPAWSVAALLLMLSSPFVVAGRLRLFRDYAREGIISFRRAWAFVILVFFYAGVLFALIQYAYFAYMDHGYLVQTMTEMMSSAEAEQLIRQSGLAEELSQGLQELQAMRPIDVALNMLSTNILAGIMLGLPIAALLQRRALTGRQSDNR